MDYAEILGKAWKTTWKYKGLWILGILAGCGSGGSSYSGGSSRPSTNYQSGSEDLPGFEYYFDQSPFFNWLGDVPASVWILLGVGLILLFLLISLVFWALGAIGKGGLFGAFKKVDQGESITLREAFQIGVNHVWKLLLIEIAVGVATGLVVLLFLIVGVGFSIVTLGIGALCIIPLILILIPLLIVLHIFALLIQVSIVVDERPVLDSVKYVWYMIKANIGEVIIIALILGVGGFIAGILIGLPILILVFPAIMGTILLSEQFLLPGMGITVALVLLYIPIALVCNGILQTFIHGSWTLFYERLKLRNKPFIVEEPAEDY